MKSFAEVNRVNSTLLILVVLLVSGCSSDDGGIVPGVVTDPDVLEEPVSVSEPVFDDQGSGLQSFELVEDSVLRARFHPADSQSADLPTIRSLPGSGRLTIESGAPIFVYAPNPDFWGEDGFRYIGVDGSVVDVVLMVRAVNDPPELSSAFPAVAAQGRVFSHQLEAIDRDSDTLRYSAMGLPDWLSLDASSGLLTGLPTQLDIGVAGPMTFRVSDTAGLFDEVSDVRIEVVDINDGPTLNLTRMPSELLARQSVTVDVFPDDPEGDAVVLEVELNSIISGEASQGSVTLTASDVNEVIDVNVVIVATDERGSVTREIVPITVYPRTDSGRGVTLAGIEDGRAVHVVILGDGYTEDQQTLFREHAATMIDNVRSDPGIDQHLDALSFHMISTISSDSGADDNEITDARDTFYDSTYNCGAIQRLICADALTMLTTAIEEYPDFDQVILLVNDLRYGGSGNSGARYAITSSYAPEIALHEMGHSLANLADEYVDNLLVETVGFPAFVEGNHPNVTAMIDPESVPWSHWIDVDSPLPSNDGDTGVGLFEGGMYRSRGVYRPTFDSRMRSFDADFGPVNSEIWVLSLYEGTDGGLRGFSPDAERLSIAAGESQSFVVSPIFGPQVQSVTWMVNGEPVEAGADGNELILSPAVGRHTVAVTVQDISGVIRREPPHAGIFERDWLLEVR